MARVLYGPGGSIISGRINGVTFQKGKYGYVANTTRWLVNKKEIRQGRVRSAFRSVVSLWRTLSPNEQLSWAISAQNTGGAYQAYVSFNIPYWLSNHIILRRNPNAVSTAFINHFGNLTDYNANGEFVQFETSLTLTVNWDVANLKPLIYMAVGPGSGAQPTRSSAAIQVPDVIDYAGTFAGPFFFKASLPNILYTIPGYIIGFWITAVDRDTEAPVGAEQAFFSTVEAFLIMQAIQMTATAHGANAPIDISIAATTNVALQGYTLISLLHYQVGTSPTTPYNPALLQTANNLPVDITNFKLTVTGQLQNGPFDVHGIAGNVLYLTFQIARQSPTSFLSETITTSCIMS